MLAVCLFFQKSIYLSIYPRLHRLSATSREVRRLTRSRKANALLWQPRAGYFVCHPC